MELYQLKTFVRVADEGNLTRAAEQLFTSQPAISAQIKALEEELGVELFERSSRGMRLTPKGRMLYDQAAATLTAAERLRHEASQLRRELVGDVRIGVHTDFDFLRIGDLHRALRQRHSRVSPHFMAGMTAQILPDVKRGALDAGFFFGPCREAGLAALHLGEIAMCVVGPAAWGERLAAAGLADIAAMPWVYTSANCPFFTLSQALFAEVDAAPETVAYVDSEDAVRELIRAGVGVSLLRADDASRLAAGGEASRWHGPAPTVALGFAVAEQRSADPVIRALRETVAELWSVPATVPGRVGA